MWGVRDLIRGYSYKANAENVIETLLDVPNEALCQWECLCTPGCAFYTHYASDAETLPDTCILTSKCDNFLECGSSCRTGPAKCRGEDARCAEGEAVVTTGYDRVPDTKTLVSEIGMQGPAQRKYVTLCTWLFVGMIS